MSDGGTMSERLSRVVLEALETAASATVLGGKDGPKTTVGQCYIALCECEQRITKLEAENQQLRRAVDTVERERDEVARSVARRVAEATEELRKQRDRAIEDLRESEARERGWHEMVMDESREIGLDWRDYGGIVPGDFKALIRHFKGEIDRLRRERNEADNTLERISRLPAVAARAGVGDGGLLDAVKEAT